MPQLIQRTIFRTILFIELSNIRPRKPIQKSFPFPRSSMGSIFFTTFTIASNYPFFHSHTKTHGFDYAPDFAFIF
ncbi:hypothetical protein NC77_28225 [Janthinobacterium lividum]|nr:hypothetical protein NC77_28225 [Janthinobacterium lividum]